MQNECDEFGQIKSQMIAFNANYVYWIDEFESTA